MVAVLVSKKFVRVDALGLPIGGTPLDGAS